MLAPIDAAWMFLKAQPTEREQRDMNENEILMDPNHPRHFEVLSQATDSRFPYNRGEEEEEDPMDTQTPPTMTSTEKPPIDQAMASLKDPSWEEGPTLGEIADMDDPEEKEHHMREAGRRSAAPSDPSQRTLHDY